MEQQENPYIKAHVQLKRMYNLMGEVQNLSHQMAEALDRNDQISLEMVMAMREEPLMAMATAREALEVQLEEMDPERGQRLRELLNGSPPALSQEEGIAAQVTANNRLLHSLLELEKPLNQRICREKTRFSQEK